MIDKIQTQIISGVDKSSKRTAEALEKLTDRLKGQPDNIIDKNVSLRLRSKYAENYMQARNAQDSISYQQTRDGYLAGTSSSLLRLKELAVQMGSPILSDSDKHIIRSEADMIMQGIDSTSKSAKFNNHKLMEDVSTSSLGLAGLKFGSGGTITAVDAAISKVATKRAETGASMNMLEARIENLIMYNENLAKSDASLSGSFIEDVAELSDSINQLKISLKTAEVVTNLNREKVMSLLDML
jgi:flagellin